MTGGRSVVSSFRILPPDYAPTYAPNTPHASEAKQVTVGLSEQVDDVDITMVRIPSVRISGTVVDARGNPVRARILLGRSQRSGAVTGEPTGTASGADGQFELRNVPPGEWVVQASTAGEMNRGQEGEFAARFVTVNSADLVDVRLQTSTGSRVGGASSSRHCTGSADVTSRSPPTDLAR